MPRQFQILSEPQLNSLGKTKTLLIRFVAEKEYYWVCKKNGLIIEVIEEKPSITVLYALKSHFPFSIRKHLQNPFVINNKEVQNRN
jgi:hypothetical protein